MLLPNYKNPRAHVRHSNLVRWDPEESDFSSLCVVCGGVLMVGRDQKTLALVPYDCCVRCGQRYFYLDDEIAGEPLSRFPKKPGDLCSKGEHAVVRRERMYYWRGRYFPGLVCEPCNALFDDPEDSFWEHATGKPL